jgi:hypothetical protein
MGKSILRENAAFRTGKGDLSISKERIGLRTLLLFVGFKKPNVGVFGIKSFSVHNREIRKLTPMGGLPPIEERNARAGKRTEGIKLCRHPKRESKELLSLSACAEEALPLLKHGQSLNSYFR